MHWLLYRQLGACIVRRHSTSLLHPGHPSVYSTVPGIGQTRVIKRPLGLLISDIGISTSMGHGQIVWHAHQRPTR